MTGKQLVRTYVVRIYRSGPEGVAGVVEDVASGRSKACSSMEAFWNALHEPADAQVPSARPTKPRR